MMRLKLLLLFQVIILFAGAQERQSLLDAAGQCSNLKKQYFAGSHDTIGVNYDLNYHRAHWHLNPNNRYIRGSVTSFFQITQATDSLSFQLADTMQVDSVRYKQNPVSYSHSNDIVTANLPSVLNAGVYDSLTIYYQGRPADSSAFAQGFHGEEDNPVLWTLSEPYGAKHWWPSKNALSDKIDSLDVFIHVKPPQYQAVSNGVLIHDTVIHQEQERILHWKHRYPIATYLVAVAVTNYQKQTAYIPFQDDSLRLVNYIYPEDYTHAVNKIPDFYKSFQLFDTLFRSYPFEQEQYGHAQMNRGGGMEHQTMTFVGDFSFHLLTHEVAHQWFGNYITLDNWHDIWLNEGFATYLTGLAYEKAYETDKWWNIWRPQVVGHITSQPGGSVYVDDISDRDRIFDARLSYHKGAYLLHMLRWILGDEAFFEAVRNYLADPAVKYGYADNEDLIYHLEQQGDTTLNEFFQDWYYGQGYPSYHVVAEPMDDGVIEVHIDQEQSHSSVDFFEMPVPVRFKDASHDTMLVFDHTENGQVFQARLGFTPDSIFCDPEYKLISADNSVLLGVNSIDSLTSRLEISPNPVENTLFVKAGERIKKLEIFTVEGKKVLNHQVKKRKQVSLSVESLPSGIYVLKTWTGSKAILSRKFIKKP
ncbi:MAG: T9SS type A sorting domain-containing protein [Bacteroidales bacterium]|nr:T9SS type A sorting domain-containing protein [Bacteroidales bacterium]MCF8332713.1 T9SS type A sorting domain-containing protein [Bacteroidales bacterium]